MQADVLVVGAGVSGLTTAVLLAEHGRRVLVRAADPPAMTNSAAAGAIWGPIYADHPRVAEWAARGYDVFAALAASGEPAVRMVAGLEASRAAIPVPGWARQIPGVRTCGPAELPAGFATGWRYRAPIIDMPRYLDRLRQRFAAAGGSIRRGRLDRLEDGFADAPVVVNCSGVEARDLVPDPGVVPIRGQLVLVRNPGITEFFAEQTDELGGLTYLLPQGDTLVLGGSADRMDRLDPAPDPGVARAIVQRCADIFPQIARAEVLGYRAGFRPGRKSIRVERVDLGDRHLIHNYGHGGAGVSVSWGCAEDVRALMP